MTDRLVDKVMKILMDGKWHTVCDIAEKIGVEPCRISSKVSNLDPWLKIEKKWDGRADRFSRIKYRCIGRRV